MINHFKGNHQMKKLGIIGGMSWESTATYYNSLNQGVRARLGGLHSANLLLHSFDFAEIEALQTSGRWDEATQEMIKAGLSLKAGGAEALMIATNTMHKMADEVEAAVQLPLFHIADATAKAIHAEKTAKPLLLATNFTMTQDFYKGRLRDQHNIQVLIPDEEDRALIHNVIYHELCQGVITTKSKDSYLKIIDKMIAESQIDSVIFGCTEIGLLLSQNDMDIVAFDTTKIHCEYALDRLI